MKKSVLFIFILIFAAVGAIGVCVMIEAGNLSVSVELPPESTSAEVSFEPEGIVRAVSVSCDPENAKAAIMLEALSEGQCVLSVGWDQAESADFYSDHAEIPLRVLKGGVIFDSVTYNFSGWYSLAFIFAVLMVLLSFTLYWMTLEERKQNGLFTYRSVWLLGISIFLFGLGVFRINYVISSVLNKDSGTVWSLLTGFAGVFQQFMVRTAPLVILFSVSVAVSNVALLRSEGFSPINMLGILIGLVMTSAVLLGIWIYQTTIVFPGRNVVIGIYSGLFVYFECQMAATIISTVLAGSHTPAYDKDYVVILGCRIRPDGTLYPLIRGRVDRAIKFVNDQFLCTGKRAVLVPSGGKGSDEKLAEAEAMANYLREQGIPESRILIENQSTTTKENMRFSKRLIDAQKQDSKVAFSTSSYHVFRGGLLAREENWSIDGMGSKTKWFYWPNAYLREFIGLFTESWLFQTAAILLISLISWCLTLII